MHETREKKNDIFFFEYKGREQFEKPQLYNNTNTIMTPLKFEKKFKLFPFHLAHTNYMVCLCAKIHSFVMKIKGVVLFLPA
jgi:hypothetical protein